MKDFEERETLDRCILCLSPQIKTFCEQNLFSQCGSCGHIFDNPRPTTRAIASFYSKESQYDPWLLEEKGRDALWKRRVRKVRRHLKGGRILDVGAGIGQFLHWAKPYFEGEGTELSSRAVEHAQKKYGVKLHEGEFEKMAWEKPFDGVTLFHVLEHVPWPQETLKACYRALKPGGVVVIAVPNDVEGWLTRRNRVFGFCGFRKYQKLGKLGLPRLSLDMAEIHLSHFTEGVLSRALEREGFNVIACGLDPYFAAEGFRKGRRYRRYFIHGGIRALTGKNFYDTLWVVAEKRVA